MRDGWRSGEGLGWVLGGAGRRHRCCRVRIRALARVHSSGGTGVGRRRTRARWTRQREAWLRTTEERRARYDWAWRTSPLLLSLSLSLVLSLKSLVLSSEHLLLTSTKLHLDHIVILHPTTWRTRRATHIHPSHLARHARLLRRSGRSSSAHAHRDTHLLLHLRRRRHVRRAVHAR